MSQTFQERCTSPSQPDPFHLFLTGCNGDEVAINAFTAHLAAALLPDRKNLYEACCNQIDRWELISTSQAVQLLNIASKIEDLVVDQGQSLLRKTLAATERSHLRPKEKEVRGHLASLLSELDEDNLSEIRKLCEDALQITVADSADLPITLDIYLTLGKALLAHLEHEDALAVAENIKVLLADQTRCGSILADPLPHERSTFQLLTDCLKLRADIHLQNSEFETCTEILEELLNKIRAIKQPASKNEWLDSIRAVLLIDFATAYLKWGRFELDEGTNPQKSEPRFQKGLLYLNQAETLIGRYPTQWLSEIVRAELRVVSGEIYIELGDYKKADAYFTDAELLIEACDDDANLIESLIDRLEDGKELVGQYHREANQNDSYEDD